MISNSLLFEKKLGWTGVLVEPNPIAFQKLQRKRRKAWTINACLSRSKHPETVLFYANGIVGGIIQHGLLPGSFQVNKEKHACSVTHIFLIEKWLRVEVYVFISI